MIRKYFWNGTFWRFEEGKQPEGAILASDLVAKEKPVPNKSRRTSNKARRAKTKENGND